MITLDIGLKHYYRNSYRCYLRTPIGNPQPAPMSRHICGILKCAGLGTDTFKVPIKKEPTVTAANDKRRPRPTVAERRRAIGGAQRRGRQGKWWRGELPPWPRAPRGARRLRTHRIWRRRGCTRLRRCRLCQATASHETLQESC